jgi:formate/nitrite transporter FocA (FNT family)
VGAPEPEEITWWKLAELWTVSPLFNVAAVALIAVVVTVDGVLPSGSGQAVVDAASRIHSEPALTLCASAVFAGALITAMTWFVEGQESVGVRVAVAWATGAFLALGGLNHVIVVAIELIFGIRFGAHVPWLFVLGNFAPAAAGSILGGIGLITLNRSTPARAQ